MLTTYISVQNSKMNISEMGPNLTISCLNIVIMIFGSFRKIQYQENNKCSDFFNCGIAVKYFAKS